MKIGYARISRHDQSLDMQIHALKNEGCDQIFTDQASGAKTDRPGLLDAFRFLREGDTLVVYKLDRLARSLKHLIILMQDIQNRKSFFHSIQERFDTNSSIGTLFFHFIGALAEFERGLTIERVKTGLEAARARGKFGGRRFKLDKEQTERLKYMYDKKDISLGEISRMFGISKQSIYNYIYKKNEKLLNETRNN